MTPCCSSCDKLPVLHGLDDVEKYIEKILPDFRVPPHVGKKNFIAGIYLLLAGIYPFLVPLLPGFGTLPDGAERMITGKTQKYQVITPPANDGIYAG